MFEQIFSGRLGPRRNHAAFINGKQSFTYGLMAADIVRCARWLTREGIGPDDRVVIHSLFGYRRWVVFFALETVGAVSAADPSPAPLTDAGLAFLGATFFISGAPPAPPMKVPGAVLDRGWLSRLRKRRPTPLRPRQRSNDDPVCVIISSGTTGVAKKVLFTREMLDRRVFTEDSLDLVNAQSRVLLELPAASIGALTMALNTWAVGGTLCRSSADLSWEEMFRRYDPTLIGGAPAHYVQILAGLPESFRPRRPVHAAVGGGTLPPALAAAVKARLGGGISMIYGSTEMGYVTRGDDLIDDDERAVGRAWRWAEVAIRREDGGAAAADEVGEVWVRGPHVVSGYLEDDQPRNSGFRDGWFHPGDLGSLRADGMLLIHGRTDDVMNYRGVKMMPSAIEAAIRRLGLTEDVAVFLARHPEANEHLVWVSAVARAPFGPDALASVMPPRIGFALSFLDAIPRNAMGKIERATLRARAENGDLDSALRIA